MVSRDEPVAREVVQGLLELFRLGQRQISGGRHPTVLAAHHVRGAALGEEGEALGQHEGKRGRQQGVEHARRRGCRVLFDAEEGADPGLGARAVFHGFMTKERPRGRQNLVKRRPRQRHALPLPVDQQAVELRERGTETAAVFGLIDAQRLRIVALQGDKQFLAQLVAQVQGVAKLRALAFAIGALEQTQRGIAHPCGLGPKDGRQVELIDHQPLPRHLLPIALFDLTSETRDRPARGITELAASHHMGPQRQVGRGDVAQQDVESFMPVVDVLVVRALEADAAQAQRLDIVPGARSRNVRIDMGGQGNHRGGAEFALQRSFGAAQQVHCLPLSGRAR